MEQLSDKVANLGYQRRFRHFTRTYQVALAMIAVLCILSNVFIDQISQHQLQDSSVIYRATNLKILCTQLVQRIDDIRDLRPSADPSQDNFGLLARTRAEWKANYKHLQDLAVLHRLPNLSKELQRSGSYFNDIDQVVRQVLISRQATEAQTQRTRAALRKYLAKHDQVVNYLLNEHDQRINTLNRVKWLSSMMIVLVLIAEGLWVFRPLVKGLKRSFDQADEQRKELERVRAELADQNQSLQQNERALSNALRRAEDMTKLSRYAAARFEELFAGLPIAAFTFDDTGAIFEWNRQAEALFDLKAPRVIGRSPTHFRVFPDEGSGYHEIVRRVFEGEHLYDCEQSIRRLDHQVRVVMCNAFPLRDPEGNITGGVCSMLDVTEARKEARRIQESEILFRTSTESIHSGIVFMDRNQIITRCNPRGAEILGIALEDFIGTKISSEKVNIIDEEGVPVPADQIPLMRAFLTRKAVADCILGIPRENGEITWLSVNASPVQLSGSDEPIGAVACFTDISMMRSQQRRLIEEMHKTNEQALVLEIKKMELEAANEQLENLATTDGLTGLKNHRSFQEILEREFLIASRYERELSLILLDVDFFKRLNDQFGHQCGDQVLKDVARVLESVGRAADTIARYGGEEFVVILPETGSEGATEVAERFREAIESYQWEHGPLTASFGVATLNATTKERAQLVAQADEALYASKRNGRNRTTHAQSLRKSA